MTTFRTLTTSSPVSFRIEEDFALVTNTHVVAKFLGRQHYKLVARFRDPDGIGTFEAPASLSYSNALHKPLEVTYGVLHAVLGSKAPFESYFKSPVEIALRDRREFISKYKDPKIWISQRGAIRAADPDDSLAPLVRLNNVIRLPTFYVDGHSTIKLVNGSCGMGESGISIRDVQGISTINAQPFYIESGEPFDVIHNIIGKVIPTDTQHPSIKLPIERANSTPDPSHPYTLRALHEYLQIKESYGNWSLRQHNRSEGRSIRMLVPTGHRRPKTEYFVTVELALEILDYYNYRVSESFNTPTTTDGIEDEY